MRIEMLRRYANGKAPFLGVPVFSLALGRYITAIFRREHLQAAASAPVTKVHYDEREHVLVLNGTKRAEYRLRDLKNSEGTAWLPGQMRKEIEAWAQSQRSGLNRKVNTSHERRIAQLTVMVNRLEREKKKLYVHAPVGPMKSLEREIASDGWRENELRWHHEKALRRKVSAIAHSPRKTWKKFYAEIELLIGRHIDSSERHDRVCGRKNGPGVIDYLHELPKHIRMARKGYLRGDSWEPFKERWGEKAELNDFQSHRIAQVEYLEARRNYEALQALIDQHLAEIAELRATQDEIQVPHLI